MELDDLKNFILHWNACWFIDRWWREKYKVSFNSREHRRKDLIDMKLEFMEDKMYFDLKKKDKKDEYQPGYNNFLKEQKIVMTDEMIELAYNNIELG